MMTLARAVLTIFCSQDYIGLYLEKQKREKNSVMVLKNIPKVDQVINTLDTIYDPNIKTLAQVVLEIFYS